MEDARKPQEDVMHNIAVIILTLDIPSLQTIMPKSPVFIRNSSYEWSLSHWPIGSTQYLVGPPYEWANASGIRWQLHSLEYIYQERQNGMSNSPHYCHPYSPADI